MGLPLIFDRNVRFFFSFFFFCYDEALSTEPICLRVFFFTLDGNILMLLRASVEDKLIIVV